MSSSLCGKPHNAEEHFVAFHLDAKNQIIGYHIVSHGTVSAIIPSSGLSGVEFQEDAS
jgi:hypothetical protein